MEWYETYSSSFTKQKPSKLRFKKQGLFDEIPRRHIREVQAPPSSPIQLDRQNANDEPCVVNLQSPEQVSGDARRGPITSNAGSDKEDVEEDEEEAWQLDFSPWSLILNLILL